MMDSE
jgi:predicted restriction endonuclease